MNKDIYVVTWANGTISILNAANKRELFGKMDREGNPVDANVKIQKVKMDQDFHLTTEVLLARDFGATIRVDTMGDDGEELVSVKLPKNIVDQAYATV